MNLGKGFPFPQEDGDPWIPVTPQKPAMRDSNPSTIELQGNQTISTSFPEVLGSSSPIAISTQGNHTDGENWQELVGIYSDILQDIQGRPVVQPKRSIHPTDKILNARSYSQLENNWTEQQSAGAMLLRHSASTMIMQQNQTLNQSQSIHSCNLQKMSNDAFPIPYQSCYNLDSPPRKEILGALHTTNCSEIAPHTPDQVQQLKNHQLSAVHNFSADGSLAQEKDKQEITSTYGQEVWIQSDQLLQSVIASPSPNSTSLKEKNICEDGGYGGIDLNRTPELKPPKRKKHRPRVVVEGKPKRTPKPTPLKTQNRTPSGKRKSVSKNSLKDSTSQEDNETKPVETSTVQSAAKSCRRALNFEKEVEMQEKDQGTTSFMGLNRTSAMPATKKEQQQRYSAETQQSESICNLLNFINQKSVEKFLPLSAMEPPTTARDHTLNVIARSINLKNVMACQTKNQLGYSQEHQQIHGEALSQILHHPNTARVNLDRAKQLILQTRIGSSNSVAEPNEKIGDYCNISDLTHSPTVHLMHLQFNGKPMNASEKSEIGNSETHGKSQFEDCTTTVKHSSRKVESRVSQGVHVSSSLYNNGKLPYSNFEVKNSFRKQTSGANGLANYQQKDPIVVGNNFQEQRYLSGVKLQRNCMAGQFFEQYTESHTPSLLIGITDQNMPSPSQRAPVTTQANETRTPEVHTALKRQMVGLDSSILACNKEKVLPKDYKKETGYFPFSKKARGQNEKLEHGMKIDDIICQLKRMQISKSSQAVVKEKQTALIPYKGDGTIVPYGGFDPIKRRKPRPKVDLDPETNQLWDFLMGKPGSKSTETMAKDKEKQWENERKVFRGRVDSFISRMHVVQGDRRFSRWKGSVVDSVIGVFLTQNVSDHLSSSAFMSLAAEFPLPRTQNLARASEEPEVQIIDPDGTITYHGRTLRQPLYKHNYREQRSDHLITETGIHLEKENSRATEEEVFSSQNSSESLIPQPNGDVQSSSDSEVEDQVILYSGNKSQNLKNTLQTETAASLRQHQGHETRSPLLDSRPTAECQKQPNPVCIRHNSASDIGNGLYGSQGSFAQRQTGHMHPSSEPSGNQSAKIPNLRKRKLEEKTKPFDWDTLRKQVLLKCVKQKRGKDKMDSLNYEALRHADVNKISEIIKERGMNNMLAGRIKDFLNRLVRDHGSIDLEWLRDVPPDKAKDYLLSIRGLGLKSVECVRLLTLHHMAFPVDTNVGRIAVRLGWVPLQPLPDSLQLHLLELYPVLESIQKYLWPRLCKLDQKTLYELHYQMITFGKVFCTKSKPNCNACPMKAECRHFASAFASTRLALPGPEERSIVSSTIPMPPNGSPTLVLKPMPLPPPETNMVRESQYISSQRETIIEEPIIEEPTTPGPSTEVSESDIEDIASQDIDEIPIILSESDIEDIASQDIDEIPTIDLSLEELKMNVWEFMKERTAGIPEAALTRALVALNPADASIPAPKLKNVNRLRTEHQVYEIPDSHPLLEGMDRRQPNDPSPYLLAIWTPGETANSTQPPQGKCSFQGTGRMCSDKTCFSCNRIREENSQIVRGTLLIPCRTATRGSFPLNGTYFQVNEVFADHDSSVTPINVPRDWLWPLARRTVYFGTSVSAIFRGMSLREIQYCFWRGFVCVRGIDQKTGATRPLTARLHHNASKKAKNNNEDKEKPR